MTVLPKIARPSRRDVVAGIVHGLVSVPDGLASGLLAGVAPIAGLYGYLVGTIVGGAATSSVFMSVQGTGAMAVLIADVPAVHGDNPTAALATLGILTGIIMLVLGVLRLGTLVRFVPNAVLIGFVNAVAVNIVLGQLGGLTGFTSDASNRVFRAVDTLINPLSFDLQTLVIAMLTIGLILALERTRIGALGLFVAVVATSALVPLFNLDSVQLLRDVAEIPAGMPQPVLPSLSLIVAMIVPALSLAFVGLVQGAAISQSVPNPNGSYPNVSGDFRGQGIANIASSLLGGVPVGGSMSATAVVRAAGARSRWTHFIAGAVMIVVIVFFSNLASYIAMPSLAALLALVGARMLKPSQLAMVWRTGPTQAVVMVITFLLTLFVPLQYAVLVGVALSVVLFVARQSNKIKVVQWLFTPGAVLPREKRPPRVLPPHQVVVLSVYGSLFFASTALFIDQLPRVEAGSRGSVVVLRLRGKDDLGSTIIQGIARYADELHAQGGHLVLAGIGTQLRSQLSSTGMVKKLGSKNIFSATRNIGDSLGAAIDHAHDLLDDSSATR